MVAIGEGAKQAALAQLQQLGAKNILIRSSPPGRISTEASQRRHAACSTTACGGRIMARLESLSQPNLAMIVPMRDTEQKVTRGDMRAEPPTPSAPTPDAFDVINLPLARGRYFNQVDYDNDAHVCVIGRTVATPTLPLPGPARRRRPDRHRRPRHVHLHGRSACWNRPACAARARR